MTEGQKRSLDLELESLRDAGLPDHQIVKVLIRLAKDFNHPTNVGFFNQYLVDRGLDQISMDLWDSIGK